MDAPHRPPRQPDGHGRREEEQAPSFLDFPVAENRTPAGITPDGSTLWLDEYQMMVGARLPAVLAGRGKSAFGMQMIADLMASGRDMECAVTDLKGAPEPDPPPAFAQGDMVLLDGRGAPWRLERLERKPWYDPEEPTHSCTLVRGSLTKSGVPMSRLTPAPRGDGR